MSLIATRVSTHRANTNLRRMFLLLFLCFGIHIVQVQVIVLAHRDAESWAFHAICLPLSPRKVEVVMVLLIVLVCFLEHLGTIEFEPPHSKGLETVQSWKWYQVGMLHSRVPSNNLANKGWIVILRTKLRSSVFHHPFWLLWLLVTLVLRILYMHAIDHVHVLANHKPNHVLEVSF